MGRVAPPPPRPAWVETALDQLDEAEQMLRQLQTLLIEEEIREAERQLRRAQLTLTASRLSGAGALILLGVAMLSHPH